MSPAFGQQRHIHEIRSVPSVHQESLAAPISKADDDDAMVMFQVCTVRGSDDEENHVGYHMYHQEQALQNAMYDCYNAGNRFCQLVRCI